MTATAPTPATLFTSSAGMDLTAPLQRLIAVLSADYKSIGSFARISPAEYEARSAALRTIIEKALIGLRPRQDDVTRCMGSGTHTRSRAALLVYAADRAPEIYRVMVAICAAMRRLQTLAGQIDYSIDYGAARDGWPATAHAPGSTHYDADALS